MLTQNRINSVELLEKCLGFDFSGTIIDETEEDRTTVAFPKNWQDPLCQLPLILNNIWVQFGPNAILAKCLGHLSAKASKEYDEAILYIQNLLTCLISLMQSADDSNVYYEIFVCVRRLYDNFLMKEFLGAANFENFWNEFSKFVVRAIQNRQFYIVEFLSRMINDVHNYDFDHWRIIRPILPSIFTAVVETPTPLSELETEDLAYQFGKICQRDYPTFISQLQVLLDTTQNYYWIVYLSGGLIASRAKSTPAEEIDLGIAQHIVANGEKISTWPFSFFNAFFNFYVNARSSERGVDELTVAGVEIKEVASYTLTWVWQALSTRNEESIKEALSYFEVLCRGYYTCKMLAKSCGTVASDALACQLVAGTNRSYRRRLFESLGLLVFSEEMSDYAQEFLEQFSARLASHSNTYDALAEIEGLLKGTIATQSYVFVFKWLYPGIFEPLVKNSGVNSLQDALELTKFMREFTNNRQMRLKFDNASPNGILIFKEAALVVAQVGQILAAVSTTNQQEWELRWSVLKNLILMVHRCIAGNYVHFGAFVVYNDNCLIDTLNCIYSLLDPTLDQFQTIQEKVYEFLAATSRYFTDLILTHLPDECIVKHVQLAIRGITLGNQRMLLNSANILTSLVEYLLVPANVTPKINNIFSDPNNKTLLPTALKTVFETMLSKENSFIWTLGKPCFGLILLQEEIFSDIVQHVIRQVMPTEKLQNDALQSLQNVLNGVERNYNGKNKDAFSSNFSKIKQYINNLF